MIRAPLTFHTPEAIYSFLEREVGPLAMLLKKGQALITFQKMEHNGVALQKCRCTILQGHPLRLFEYKDGDLNAKPEAMNIEPAEEIVPIQTQAAAPMIPAMSDTAKMVEEAI
jgi:hypothetical protein